MAERKKEIKLEGKIVGFQREESKFIVMVEVSEEKVVKLPIGSSAELIIYTE